MKRLLLLISLLLYVLVIAGRFLFALKEEYKSLQGGAGSKKIRHQPVE